MVNLERPFEGEKPVSLMGLEACTCPSLGLNQERITAHLQAGWAGPGSCSKSGLASRRGVESTCSSIRTCAVWRILSLGTACVSSAVTRFRKPLNNSAKRAEYQSRQYFLVIVLGKRFSHSVFAFLWRKATWRTAG